MQGNDSTMDDSDLDFVNLCSKLLKRVRKKPDESRQPRKAEHQSSSQASEGDKRTSRNHKKDADSQARLAATQDVTGGGDRQEVDGEYGCNSGVAGSSVVPSTAAAGGGPIADRGQRAKDKVLLRMQQFKRDSPRKMMRKDTNQSTNHDKDCAPFAQQQRGDIQPVSSSLQPHLSEDSDEALALRLQQELDREAAEAQTVDLEDGGLFFCQICQRDLSHMTPEGRTQHLNRCLDESEHSAPAPPPISSVPDCPICGKKFKSQKSRSAHLKRCSSDMGVSPAVLLQALQRQAEESQNIGTANTHTQTVSTKRKGPPKPGIPARKKPKKKTEPLDEETMMALALSSSLLQQEMGQQREEEAERRLQTASAASHSSMTPVLKWRPDTGKVRGKRKKGAVPRPPPLLLIQDAEVALSRLQERVSALLLCTRAPSPPTPTRCPSTLPIWSGTAPLWQKSTLLDGGPATLSDFYCAELRQFFTSSESVKTDATSFSSSNKPESSVQPVDEGTPVPGTRAPILPSSSKTCSSSPASSTPGTGQPLVDSQALRDLMELAEDGMTLTQCGYTAKADQQVNASPSTNLHRSGFVQEESEEQADLCASGFLPETVNTHSNDTHSRAIRTTDQRRADKDRESHKSVVLSRLASDLSSMVNNPQLSDVQLQVDSGEVYFAHSFMMYARCPLLAELVHESGFGVQEEGMPAAQRVLMSDVPGQAVFALLQYLYTAHCSIPASLQPHVLELASRFDLQELQQLCQLHQEETAALGDEADCMNQEENINSQTDQAFIALLHSMWNEEDEDDDGVDSDGGRVEGKQLEEERQADEVTSGDREIHEEQMNEEELEEIYEFAATQRRKEEKDSEEEVEKRLDEEESVFTNLMEPKQSFIEKKLQPNSQLDPSKDLSYSRLFSQSWGVYEEGNLDQSKTQTPQFKHQSPHKPPPEMSCRTLLRSSADNLSLSSPPITSNLPVPGLSPGQVGDCGDDGDNREDIINLNVPKEDEPLKQESQGPRSICIPLSPDLPQKKEEPELIVLSDSSEEMEVDDVILSSRSPSPPSPHTAQNPLSHTEIKSKQIPTPNKATVENKVSSSLNLSPSDPSDCSPEVSWLIPSTPVQSGRSTTTSTQTRSSMCRTQLFPIVNTSPPSSSVFSSPMLPCKKTLPTYNSPARDSAHVVPTEGSVSRLEFNRSSGSHRSFSLKKSCNSEANNDRQVFPVPPYQLNQSHLSSSTHSHSRQASLNTPLHLQPHPYSSTPLHTELHQPPALPAASPLHTDHDEQGSTSERSERVPSESPEKTGLGSFRLSTLSEPSDPPSSHSGLQSSKKHSKSSNQSRRPVEISRGDDKVVELIRRGGRNKEGESDCDSDRDDREQEETKRETGEADIAESSFQHSFMAMDEPPIAFNDSWGLDACAEATPGCFSLRLEDSGPSSQQKSSPGQQKTAKSSSSSISQPPSSSHSVQSLNSHSGVITPSPSNGPSPQSSSRLQPLPGPSVTPSPPDPNTRTTPEIDSGLLDSKIWDSWEEEAAALPLSQRLNPPAKIKTPTSSHNKRRRTLVPITPMPHYSDMDTPELKNKLTRFGVRPLPKRQMILKLKEIHQYTHQLASSDSEDEAPSAGHAAQKKSPPRRPVSCAQTEKFKEPRAPAALSPVKHNREEEEEEAEAEPLSASQGSNTSSTAASEESERSNPELCISSDDDSDSDGGISSSQAASRLQDRLQAARSFILSDSDLYSQILQYKPLVLSHLQKQLKAAGIRLGAAKLMDYLDSQCITFTTAKPGQAAPSRRQVKRTGTGAKTGKRGASRKKGIT